MKKATIIGSGLSGLIAANLLSARGYDIKVYECQKSLPDNHQAVLRFRSPNLGEALGIPFRKVKTLLCLSHPTPNPMLNAFAYSYATTGVRRTDRSIVRLFDGPKVVDRWIAPIDIKEILFDRIQERVHFERTWSLIEDYGPTVISTIPMNLMHKMAKDYGSNFIATSQFRANQYIVMSAYAVDTEAYGSVYNPQPTKDVPWTRFSITGPRVTLEISTILGKTLTPWSKKEFSELFESLTKRILGLDIDHEKGPIRYYHSVSDRILPISDRFRKTFIMHMTDKYNVYSLGRFATWRPGMLLDDIIQDTSAIASMIEGDTAPRYEAKK